MLKRPMRPFWGRVVLNDIAAPPGAGPAAAAETLQLDSRLALAVYPVDPRIHFAITCGQREPAE